MELKKAYKIVDNKLKLVSGYDIEKYIDNGFIVYKDNSKPDELLSQMLINNISNTKSSLMQLCDSKQDEAQKMVLGYKATPMQLERYKDKYQRALAGEFDVDTNNTIITKHKTYLVAIRKLVDLIEYFRSKVDDLIEVGNLDKANECIELAKEFDADTTFEEVKVLLGVN